MKYFIVLILFFCLSVTIYAATTNATGTAIVYPEYGDSADINIFNQNNSNIVRRLDAMYSDARDPLTNDLQLHTNSLKQIKNLEGTGGFITNFSYFGDGSGLTLGDIPISSLTNALSTTDGTNWNGTFNDQEGSYYLNQTNQTNVWIEITEINATGTNTAAYLKRDGTWNIPAGGGDFLADGTIPMTGTLQMDTNSISDIRCADFIPTNSTVCDEEGNVYWDIDDHTLALRTDDTNVIHQVGQEFFIRAKKEAGDTISNGDVVYKHESSSDRPVVKLADAVTNNYAIGFATADFTSNDGWVTSLGLVRDVDTSSFSTNDDLYVSIFPGSFTNVSANDTLNPIGFVVRVHASAGIIYANPIHPLSTNIIQVGDNVSLLNNDAGYLDSSSNILDTALSTNIPRKNAVNNYSNTNDYTGGTILVPTATANTEAINKAQLDAAVAAPPTNTAIFGSIYIHDGTSTNTLTPSDTYVQLSNWTAGKAVGMTLSSTNITVTTDGTYLILQFISGSDGVNKTIETAIHTNDVHIDEGEWIRKLNAGGDVGSASGGGILTLNSGDTISLWAQCVGSTTDFIIEQGQLLVHRLSSVTSGTNWTQHPALNDVNLNGFSISNGYVYVDYVQATNTSATNYFLGKVGVGTIPSIDFHVDGQSLLEGDTYPILNVMRETSVTNFVSSAFQLTSKTTGDMVNGFGGGFVFATTDNSGVTNLGYRMYNIRNGADDSYRYALWNNNLTEVFSVEQDGKTGIGDVSPEAALEVVSNGTPLMVSSAAGADGDLLIVTSSGLVGVGIVNPATNFHVNGEIRSGNTDDYVIIGEDANDPEINFFESSSEVAAFKVNNRDMYFVNRGTSNSHDIIFRTKDTEDRLHIEGGGDIGIGNANPTEKLDVNGNILTPSNVIVRGSVVIGPQVECGEELCLGKTNGNSTIEMTRLDESITDGNSLGNIAFGGAGDAGGTEASPKYGAKIEAKADGTWTGATVHPGRLEFFTANNGDAGTVVRHILEKNGTWNTKGNYISGDANDEGLTIDTDGEVHIQRVSSTVNSNTLEFSSASNLLTSISGLPNTMPLISKYKVWPMEKMAYTNKLRSRFFSSTNRTDEQYIVGDDLLILSLPITEFRTNYISVSEVSGFEEWNADWAILELSVVMGTEERVIKYVDGTNIYTRTPFSDGNTNEYLWVISEGGNFVYENADFNTNLVLDFEFTNGAQNVTNMFWIKARNL